MKAKIFIIISIFPIIIFSQEKTSKASYHLEPIYVQGEYLEKKETSTSQNTTVIDTEDINNLKATHFEELINSVPNLNGTKGSSRTRFFTIRGIGERAAYEGTPNYSVGIIIDDIDYSGSGSISNLGGISQVEVYKGPQATRMGPSAVGGHIYMGSKSPTNKPSGSLLLSVESFNTFKEQVEYAAPLTETIGTSVSLSKTDSDGYIENTYLDRKDTSGLDELSVKSKTVYKKNDLKASLSLHHHKSDNGYDYFNQENSLKTKSDKPGEDDQNILAGSLKLEYGNKPLKFVSLLSHFDDQSFYSYDEDWGNDPLWNSTPGYNSDYDYNIEFTKHRRHYLFEQRAIIHSNLVVGLYHKSAFERFREKGFQDEAVRKNISGNYKTQNNAVFLQNTNRFSDKRFIDYGIRIENRNVLYEDTLDNNFTPSETMVGGKIGYRIQESEYDVKFVTFSKGFKAGGVNTQSGVEDNRKTFEQEDAYNLEMGIKTLWGENLKTTVTGFYMLRENVQVKTSYQDNPSDPSSYTFYTDNATSGKSYGLEGQVIYYGLNGIELNSNLSIIKSEYDDYEYGDKNLKGRAYPNAPEYKVNTFLKYSITDNYYISTNYLVSDGFFYSNSHDQRHPSYQIVDFSTGYQNASWNVSLWSKNIFDEKTYSRGFYFANEPPNWEDTLYTQRNSPRSYGFTLKYLF